MKLESRDYLEYYVACSSSDGTLLALEYSLKAIKSDEPEILFDKRRYSRALGYGMTSFNI